MHLKTNKFYKIKTFCTFTLYIFIIIFSSCHNENNAKVKIAKEITGTQLSINDSIESTIEIENALSPYRKRINLFYKEIIGKSEKVLAKAEPEGTLGNLIADIILERAEKESGMKMDLAIMNNGGIRKPIFKGNISAGDIFEVMPFDNKITIVELTGDKLLKLADQISNHCGEPISGNAKVEILGKGKGKIFLNGKEPEPGKKYFVATHSYLSQGGGGLGALGEGNKVHNTGYDLRDAIINKIKDLTRTNSNISVNLEGRVVLLGECN